VAEVEAAGGVVLRGVGAAVEVLVVHRTRHRDWSLPKGKVESCETHQEAAFREVLEETGYRTRLGVELPEVRYRDARGRAKRVRWWTMTALDQVPGPVDPVEITAVSWVPVVTAESLLTHATDRQTLSCALAARGV
jgi:8-oxo-dGTP diphosphatase